MSPGPLGWEDLDGLPVTVLRGVGETRRKGLEEMGIGSVADLLMHYPRRYVDRTREARVADARVGEECMVVAEVIRTESRRIRNRRTMINVDIADDSGRMRVTFFNQAWRIKQLTEGRTAVFFGKVTEYRGRRQMTSPVVDLVGDRTGRVVPVYPQSEKAGLMSWDLAAWVEESLRRCRARGIADPVPAAVLAEQRLAPREWALTTIHTPASMGEVVRARNRLVFDELLRIQMVLLRRKREMEEKSPGIEHPGGSLTDEFVAALPFTLTGAQTRTIAEIAADLARPVPMHRLLQGDVGAGKTVVAVATMLTAVDGGHQGVLMAPTEVLAEQHHRGISELLGDMEVADEGVLGGRRPLAVELLTGSMPVAERRRVLTGLMAGSVDVVVGTHALIQEGVAFHSLGVVVVDEQHRFGVEQRAWLRERGRPDGRVPDLLVMTATPIPRSAAMTVYGDLDVSVLDELPPGRTPIVTRSLVAGSPGEDEMWAHVRDQVAEGRQVYVVCPLIEESEKLEVASAQTTHEELSSGELAGLRVGLIHGRMKPRDKEETMSLFRSGRFDVLVATTVIEVGVDVPNATIMVILSADRFGIAQLHQLRGRVGRGAHESHCYLVADSDTAVDGDPAAARLQALVKSTDGFELAEIDLDLRGEGTLFDDRQSGRNDLRLASLRRDREWVVRAREVARSILESDPGLDRHPGLAAELEWFVDRGVRADALLRG